MDGHIGLMSRPSNREKILTEGMRVVHERGFAGASVRDIVQAAGVPQGSFTNHFASKEAFGLEVIDLYFANSCDVVAATLRNDALPPLERLGAYIDTTKNRLNRSSMRTGWLFGNFTAGGTAHRKPIPQGLLGVFPRGRAAFPPVLRAAAPAGGRPR